jgi:hypothetical protein
MEVSEMLEIADYRKVANIWSAKFAPLLERWGFVMKQVPYEGAEYTGENDYKAQSWEIYWQGNWLTFLDIYFKRYFISGGAVGIKFGQLREIEFRQWVYGENRTVIYCSRRMGKEFGKEKLAEVAENLFRSCLSWLVVGAVRGKLPYYLGATLHDHIPPNIWVSYSFRLYKNCWIWKLQWETTGKAQKLIAKGKLDENPFEGYENLRRSLVLALYL